MGSPKIQELLDDEDNSENTIVAGLKQILSSVCLA